MTPQAFPLSWPIGRPRKTASQRRAGQFRASNRSITVADAANRLEDEVGRLGGQYLVISTNIQPTLGGRPRSSQPEPHDPGVCAYFSMAGKLYALACDSYTAVAQNIAALAAHVDATRAITRHGVASAAETLRAFEALPAPTPEPTWREVLGIPTSRDLDAVSVIYRRYAKDAAGDEARLKRLNVARDQAVEELS